MLHGGLVAFPCWKLVCGEHCLQLSLPLARQRMGRQGEGMQLYLGYQDIVDAIPHYLSP